MTRWRGDPDLGPGGWDCDSDAINDIRDSMTWSHQLLPRAPIPGAMSHAAEELMGELRVKLGQAAICERRGEIELADAYGAVAGNKLARAYRIAYKVTPLKAEK